MTLLESSPKGLLTVDKLSPIARTNLIAAGLTRLPKLSSSDLVEWLLEITSTFEKIDPVEVNLIINMERGFSGFPKVTDISAVEAEIQERQRHYHKVIKSAIDKLTDEERAETVTVAAKSATDGGEKPVNILIAGLVDSYDVEMQKSLDEGEENIRALARKLRRTVDDGSFDPYFDSTEVTIELCVAVGEWNTIAKPLQVIAKSRGLDHKASHRIGKLLRSLATDIFQFHHHFESSQLLRTILQREFAEVKEIVELVATDEDNTEDIVKQGFRSFIEHAKNRTDEWQREMTYEVDVGIFKNKLCISPDCILWKGDRWDIDSITKVRWGKTIAYGPIFGTWPKYHIIFGNGSNYASIKLVDEKIYDNIARRLWMSVVARLLMEFLEGLRDGKSYRFSSAVISDHGMELERKKLFGSNERVFCRWSELALSTIRAGGFGMFALGKKLDADFFWLREDNIHVLYLAIYMHWKRGAHTDDRRLSSILGD